MTLRRASAALVTMFVLVAPATSALGRVCEVPGTQPAGTRPAVSARPAPTLSAVRRFWVKDRHFYRSDWYAGAHRKMIGFGCTAAPYYTADPRCRHRQGFHHGIDIAMPCGTRLFAGLHGRVVRPSAPGSLGSAYGPYAFRLRNSRLGVDVVIGHVRRVYVRPGQHVNGGSLIARASDQGAPDGCHLHFEVRPIGTGYESAILPLAYLHLQRVG
jgi:murein DD-endopeptidase MepM/ murein hydrolase activator NlpD